MTFEALFTPLNNDSNIRQEFFERIFQNGSMNLLSHTQKFTDKIDKFNVITTKY